MISDKEFTVIYVNAKLSKIHGEGNTQIPKEKPYLLIVLRTLDPSSSQSSFHSHSVNARLSSSMAQSWKFLVIVSWFISVDKPHLESIHATSFWISVRGGGRRGWKEFRPPLSTFVVLVKSFIDDNILGSCTTARLMICFENPSMGGGGIVPWLK